MTFFKTINVCQQKTQMYVKHDPAFNVSTGGPGFGTGKQNGTNKTGLICDAQ